jgi:hypothetical protein
MLFIWEILGGFWELAIDDFYPNTMKIGDAFMVFTIGALLTSPFMVFVNPGENYLRQLSLKKLNDNTQYDRLVREFKQQAKTKLRKFAEGGLRSIHGAFHLKTSRIRT